MKNILIVGKESNINSGLSLNLEGFNIAYTSRRSFDNSSVFYFDILDDDFLKKFDEILVEINPSIILWCIGQTNIEECQSNASTYDLNVSRTNSLINLISQRNINFIYFSSNAVFACDSEISNDKEKYSPTCKYGKQKVEVERYIFKKNFNSAIIRLSKLISFNDGFLKAINERQQSKDKIRLFSDVYIAPITYNYLNNFLEILILNFKPGIFNLSADFILNYMDLIELLVERNLIKLNLSLCEKTKNSDALFKPRYPKLPMIDTLNIMNFDYLTKDQFIRDLS